MKIQIVSDLHREVGVIKIPIVGDILVLAGDITSGSFGNITRLSQWLESIKIPVYYVLGNHEYYRNSTSHVLEDFKNALKNTSVTILENNHVFLEQEDTVIIGATLWTDLPILDEAAVTFGMSDFKVVSGISVDWWRDKFNISKQYIEYMLKEYSHIKNRIVITHHLPSMESVPRRFKDSAINAGFATELSELILDREPTLWIHGHTHDSVDYHIGKTRVVCNPYGYMGYETNPYFKEEFIMEV